MQKFTPVNIFIFRKMNLFSQKFWSREALELLCFDARIMEVCEHVA